MSYNYKIVSYTERPGHVILIIITVLSLLLAVCLCVLLGVYVAEIRKQEDGETQTNYTSDGRDQEPENVTDGELAVVAQALWDADKFRLDEDHYAVALQAQLNKTNRDDLSPRSFFPKTIDLHARSDTYSKFLNLMNNFERTTRLPDLMTSGKLEEVNQFLDAVLASDVMRFLQHFLAEKGLISENSTSSLRQLLFEMWFQPYSRSPKYNITDSSGFEHVFVGEIRGNKAMGMHFWLQLHQQEIYGDWEYMGYLTYSNVTRVYNVQFRWHRKLNKACSFFLGTSPEFDMAVYTLCLLTRTNRECAVNLNGTPLSVQTHDVRHVPKLQIGTAFPKV